MERSEANIFKNSYDYWNRYHVVVNCEIHLIFSFVNWTKGQELNKRHTWLWENWVASRQHCKILTSFTINTSLKRCLICINIGLPTIFFSRFLETAFNPNSKICLFQRWFSFIKSPSLGRPRISSLEHVFKSFISLVNYAHGFILLKRGLICCLPLVDEWCFFFLVNYGRKLNAQIWHLFSEFCKLQMHPCMIAIVEKWNHTDWVVEQKFKRSSWICVK